MKIEIGDIIFSHGNRLLVIHDPYGDDNDGYPYVLINLENFQIHNAYKTIDSMARSFKIDKVLNEYQITLSK